MPGAAFNMVGDGCFAEGRYRRLGIRVVRGESEVTANASVKASAPWDSLGDSRDCRQTGAKAMGSRRCKRRTVEVRRKGN